jgi:hypothetical protein
VKSRLCYAHKLDVTKKKKYHSAEGENSIAQEKIVSRAVHLKWDLTAVATKKVLLANNGFGAYNAQLRTLAKPCAYLWTWMHV